jgi:hypothetical protein
VSPAPALSEKPPRRPVVRGWEVVIGVLLVTLSTLGAAAMMLAMLEGGQPLRTGSWRSIGMDVGCLLATLAFYATTALWIRARRPMTSRWVGWAVFVISALVLLGLFGDQWRVRELHQLNDMVPWVAGLLGAQVLVWWTGPRPQAMSEAPPQRQWRSHALLAFSLSSLAFLVTVLLFLD